MNYLQNLEKRIAQIESHLKIISDDEKEQLKQDSVTRQIVSDSSDALEFKIGQLWFSKAGIVVLAIGIILALIFPYSDFQPFLPSLIGYVLVLGILALSHVFRNSFSLISRYLFLHARLVFF